VAPSARQYAYVQGADWFGSHHILIGLAALMMEIAAVLYLRIAPITVLLVAIICLTAGFAALVDPKDTLP
jgi:hypothetical protein